MPNITEIKNLKGFIAKGAAIAAGAAVVIKTVSDAISSVGKLKLKDKVVLITGGSRGLGLILARKLAEHDAVIVICGRSEETLRLASEEFTSKKENFLAISCDITDRQQVKQMIGQIREEAGTVDILINNAGIIKVGPMETMNRSDYEEAMETHFWGPFHLINEVLPDMKEKEQGNIVNIASIGGKVSFPHLLPYNTSKFAMSGFSEGLSAELKKYNITVTSVYPGLMRTGSPRNIDVKGQHQKEYGWFKIADSLPFISMNAEEAAGKIIEALRERKRSLILSTPAKIAIAVHGIAPEFTIAAFNLIDYLLPSKNGGETTKKGYESELKISSSFLAIKTDKAARKNLEVDPSNELDSSDE